ncbi:hypothetical protein GCM10023221_13610 [Luteimicrobium xylanilyticum]|uniref:Lycopene cyclase domain-containing protein n=1 Tax=Luteimicrobium xylanilyticum TaxID=1133546 RepID=A0A5P9QCQ9_9MICO|nr:lycopene cyclase domain-containing protein [Luteimicrobium xylanilyticum]QFU99167.1 hypothetical protein KDY119_02693 [Luteimicrobium xylanilyticum]
MTYAFLDLGALAVLAVPFGLACRRWAARGELRRRLAALGLALLALLVVTAVFDSLMIAAGLFTYDAATLAGPRVGRAPLADLAYPLGAVLLLPSVWELLGPSRPSVPDVPFPRDDRSAP